MKKGNPPRTRCLFIITLFILPVTFISCKKASPKQVVSKQKVSPPPADRGYFRQWSTQPEIGQPHLKQWDTNFKSAQPEEDQLLRILNKYRIDVVIRLNADRDKLSIKQEAEICKSQHVQFYYFYIEDDPQAAYQQIRNFLHDGHTLVHCRHGYDRSGVIFGLWLKEIGATDREVIAFNQWENYLQKRGKPYRKYWNAVFKHTSPTPR